MMVAVGVLVRLGTKLYIFSVNIKPYVYIILIFNAIR